MIYSRDLWIQLPVRDIYDSLIMMASVNAARDMYEKGVQLIKDFNKQYGDFFSPIQKDMDWYNKNVIGSARDFINNLYDQGIDPTRSAEGRAMISRYVNNAPIGEINLLKQSAKDAELFLNNRAILIALGKYSKEMDDAIGGGSPEDWDTLQNGIFTRTAPIEAKTLQEFVHPSFQGIKPHMLSKEEVEGRGYKYNPAYDYTGISRSDMEGSIRDWMPGVKGNSYYDFFRNLAKQDLIRSGILNPTEAQIDKQFADNAITADHQVMTPIAKEANPYTMENIRFGHQLALLKDAQLFQREMTNAPGNDTSGNVGSVSSSNSAPNPLTTRTLANIIDNNIKAMRNATPQSVITGALDYWDRSVRYNKLGTKAYNTAVSHKNWWSNVQKLLNSAKTSEQYVNILKKNNLIDKSGNYSTIFSNAYMYSQGTGFYGNGRAAKGVLPGERGRVSKSYNRFVVSNVDSGDITTAIKAFTNNAAVRSVSIDKDLTLTQKRRLVNLTNGHYSYSPVRWRNATGSSYTKGSLSQKFNHWLTTDKNIVALNGSSNAQDTKIARVPELNGYSFDINGYIEIPARLIKKFADSIGFTEQQLANRLGLKHTNEEVTNKNNLNVKITEDFYYVPVTKHNKADMGYFESINNTNYTDRYGKPNAAKFANNALGAATIESR